MPIYRYECLTCGQRIEEIQKLDAPPPTSCEDCPRAKEGEESPCRFEKRVTRAYFKFAPGMTEGGGWERQGQGGETLVRTHKGKNTTKYGEGHV